MADSSPGIRAIATALTATFRAPMMFASLGAASIVGELALRGCEAMLSPLGYDPAKRDAQLKAKIWQPIQTAADWVGFHKFLSVARPWAKGVAANGDETNGTVRLAQLAAAAIVWSAVGNHLMNTYFTKPHWLYNTVLKHISVIRIADTTPVQHVWATAKAYGVVS